LFGEHTIKLTNDGGSLNLVGNGCWTLHAAVPRPKGWEVYIALAAVRECANTHAFSLKVLNRPRDIEEALAPAGNNCHWCSTELCQIRRYVHARFGTTMDTSKTAGTKDFDSCKVC
jgi:hypothetical protein